MAQTLQCVQCRACKTQILRISRTNQAELARFSLSHGQFGQILAQACTEHGRSDDNEVADFLDHESCTARLKRCG